MEPTRELAQQTHKNIQLFCAQLSNPPIRSMLVVGGVPIGEMLAELQEGVEIITGTVGRIGDLFESGQISLKNLRFFVVDEAETAPRTQNEPITCVESLRSGIRILRAGPVTKETSLPTRALCVSEVLFTASNRVESVDVHESEPYALTALADGHIHLWNFCTQNLFRTLKVSEKPVKAARFIAAKLWIATATEDADVHIYNLITFERIRRFKAHILSLRSMIAHPNCPLLLTCSEDSLIKLWDLHECTMKQSFKGHTGAVTHLAINPRDDTVFATASRDKTVKVWQFGSATPNFSLQGHDKAVNSVDYYTHDNGLYIISGADDGSARIWDCEIMACIRKLELQNVSSVAFHDQLRLIVTGSKNSTIDMWNWKSCRIDCSLACSLGRVRCICARRGAIVAVGCDGGSVVYKLERKEESSSEEHGKGEGDEEK